MRRGWRMMLALVLPMAAWAEDAGWEPLSGAQISAVLTGKTLDYGTQWQDFRASGRTLYFSGQDAWGYWGVRGDQYCSMWPPSDLWACYDMARKGGMVRFIGQGGETTDAVVMRSDAGARSE
ncbi:MAG: hypothetical protein AB8B60_04460 [Sulfitobacter sp.]